MQIHKNQILNSVPIIAIGMISVPMQVLMMQELISQFYGNELCIGTTLAFWLIWTATGSGLLPKLLPAPIRVQHRIAIIQLAWAFVIPCTLWLVRSAKSVIGIPAAEMAGFSHMLIITTIVLGPFCLLSGYLYTLVCHWKEDETRRFSPPRVYTLESIGAGLGGLLASFIFIRALNSFQIGLFLSGFSLFSAWILLSPHTQRLRFTLPILLGYCILWYFSVSIQTRLDALYFPNQSIVLSKNTPYGQIHITRLQDQTNVYQNGLWMYTSPDPLSAESSVHFALLQHPAPKRVLQISGGVDLLREILKHPSVQHIDYVEINPALIQMIRRQIPGAKSLVTDPRIHIHHMDARQYIDRYGTSYDVILSNLPNPYTNQLNRFYTLEFFKAVKNRLNSQGIFTFQVRAEENVINPELSDFLSMLSATVRDVFPDLTILPGEVQHWLASTTPGLTFSNPDRLQSRINERRLQTRYIRYYFIQYTLSRDRIAQVMEQIHPTSQRNTDFKPLGYYYDTVLWVAHFSHGFKTVYQEFSKLHLSRWIFFIAVLFLIIFLLQQWKKTLRWRKLHILASIWIVGFTEISLEIILILGFQILWGATYQILAILIASYMLGLSLGSLRAWKLYQLKKARFETFRRIQAIVSLYVLLCIGTVLFSRWMLHQPFHSLIPPVFVLLTLFAGSLGGFQFVLANHLYIHSKKELSHQAGFLYSSDLSGSAFGAFICSVLLIPILGIIHCLLLLSLMNGCISVLMYLKKNNA
ncbi:fused MFS/spermidine synthase [bacterium]|nr:fused MFS/spermidine synthase [bacterium]